MTKPAPNVVVAITYQALPGKAEPAVAALSDLIRIVVAEEPDCSSIRLYQDPAEQARIFLFEEWTSREAYLGPHLETPHLLAFKERAASLFLGPPERSFWRLEVEAPDPSAGADSGSV